MQKFQLANIFSLHGQIVLHQDLRVIYRCSFHQLGFNYIGFNLEVHTVISMESSWLTKNGMDQ